MQKITVLCVGKLKEKFYQEAAEYTKRLRRHCKLEIVELPESRLPEDPSPAEIQRALAAEAAAIRKGCPGAGGYRPVHRGEALLQRGAEPPDGGPACPESAADLSHRRQRGARRGPEKAGRLAAVHVPHDLPPPPGPDHAAGADLPGISDRRRDKISQINLYRRYQTWTIKGAFHRKAGLPHRRPGRERRRPSC